MQAMDSERGPEREKDGARHAEERDDEGVEEAPVHMDDMEGIDKEIENAAGDDVPHKGSDGAADKFYGEKHERRQKNECEDDKAETKSCDRCHRDLLRAEQTEYFLHYRRERHLLQTESGVLVFSVAKCRRDAI